MKISFWGCRGSLPASYSGKNTRTKVQEIVELALQSGLDSRDQIDAFVDDLPFHLKGGFGTNTSCVQISSDGDELVICDAGSGLRDLGHSLMAMAEKRPSVMHFFISHLHWDHIQGFPFFIPAYIPGTTIHIYGCHQDLEETFIRQQAAPTFPVPLKEMGSEIHFHVLDRDKKHHIAGKEISIIEQPHPGKSYGYRFHQSGKTVVYSTDAEHTEDSQSEDYRFLDFFKDADILIFDGQFNLADHLFTKQNWGHSSNLVGIELAVRAGVKKLCLFHSDHTFVDHDLTKFLSDSKRYLNIYDEGSELDVVIAYDGLVLDLADSTPV